MGLEYFPVWYSQSQTAIDSVTQSLGCTILDTLYVVSFCIDLRGCDYGIDRSSRPYREGGGGRSSKLTKSSVKCYDCFFIHTGGKAWGHVKGQQAQLLDDINTVSISKRNSK